MADSDEPLREWIGFQALAIDPWGSYKRWNQALCEHFFSGHSQGRPIYMDLDHRALQAVQALVFPGIKQPQTHLVTSVRATLNTSSQKANPFQVHITNCHGWQTSQYSGYPPFAALLGLFSLVAEQMVADDDFAPNNYYGRLREILCLPEHAQDNLIDGYRVTASALWPALNSWLTEWNGALGLPTARALDHRRYVSVAISQALVREHDRALLRRMFWDLQFEPRQRVRREEMRSALAHWIGQGRQATSLGRLFARGGEITEHIIELSCSELEAWDGSGGRPEAGAASGRLAIVATLQRHPLPKIELFLAALIPSDITDDIDVRLTSGSNDIARAAIAGAFDRMRLERIQDTDIISLEPWSEMRPGDVLLAKIELEAPSRPERKFARSGSPLCVLSYREREGVYKEVAQAPLMERILVLAHDSISTRVQEHLERSARPGFRAFSASELLGLPTRWIAFIDVQIARSIDTPGLECLAPLSTTALFALGGMNMGYETWHGAALPELSIADSEAQSPLRVTIGQELALLKRVRETAVDGIDGGAVIALTPYGLPDGDYAVSVYGAGGGSRSVPAAQLRFRLRSSDSARPRTVVAREELVYAVVDVNPRALLSASYKKDVQADPALESGTCIAGANVMHARAVAVPPSSVPIPREIGKTLNAEAEIERGGINETVTAEVGSCVQRGYHVWTLPFIQPGAGRPRKMLWKCGGCANQLWVKGAGKKPLNGKKEELQQSSSARSAQSRKPEMVAVPERAARVGFDIVFDGLNYLRGGSFAGFSALVSAANDSPWAAYEYARELAACCHIDLRLDAKSLRPAAWMISPTALVGINEGRAVLVGWRSRRLLSRIVEIASKRNAKVISQWSPTGIPVVCVNGIPNDELPALCDQLGNDGDTTVQHVDGLAPRLIESLPPLKLVVQSLERVRPPISDLEVFDFQAMRWSPARRCDAPGAYRSRWRGVTYLFVPKEVAGSGEGRVCDARTAKYLAAAELGHALIGYLREQRALVVPIGCELPGLLERVAIMCHGAPPQRENGRVRYDGVPESIALGIWSRLV